MPVQFATGLRRLCDILLTVCLKYFNTRCAPFVVVNSLVMPADFNLAPPIQPKRK